MTSNHIEKKTPSDVSAFERDQLRFFLSNEDLPAVLTEINPSLAWLPVLLEMKIIHNETQLSSWVERNFSKTEAVREVVCNIRFFGPETANFLENRLNSSKKNLPPLLYESWRLIIRHMGASRRNPLQNEWFEIVRQLRQGDHSTSTIERLANALRPRLRIGKRIHWRAQDDLDTPKEPFDLMSISFEVDEDVSPSDVLGAWPTDTEVEVDKNLLRHLTTTLIAALEDAMDVGVEGNEGYSASDSDVPSVADHNQNEYRSGFQAIVRVMAEVWTRLAAKSPDSALEIASQWQGSSIRLMRRLSLYAAANTRIERSFGENILSSLPTGELFLTNSSVEVYNLIRRRWTEFSEEKKEEIVHRLCQGPPSRWFRAGAEIDKHTDRARFDILSDIEREGLDIGSEGRKVLADIRARWPQWAPKLRERAGFHVWHEAGTSVGSERTSPLGGVTDAELVAEARKATATSPAGLGSWASLCSDDPDRALRGLAAAAQQDDWPRDYWEQLLASTNTLVDAHTGEEIASLLLRWPVDSFTQIAAAASFWLDGHSKTLVDALLWQLWDRVADVTLTEPSGAVDA